MINVSVRKTKKKKKIKNLECFECKKKLTISNYHVLSNDIYCRNHYDKMNRNTLEKKVSLSKITMTEKSKKKLNFKLKLFI